MKAIIVGAGIGGLAAAVALHRRGWQVEVIERAPRFTEVGAGLSLWPNALRALDALGIGDQVRKHALLETQAGIQDPLGRWLSRTNTDELERRYGQMAMLHRADLLNTLRDALPGEVLRTGVEVTVARRDGTVAHSEGESSGDIVVGADGIHSIVRRSIWPQAPAPRHVGYRAWRTVTRPVPLDEGVETWGRGERLGYAALPDGRAYMFAVANSAPGAPDGGPAELRRRFGSWHSPIPTLLSAAEGAPLHCDDLYELPPLETFTAGKVVLLGDAAHAMTPNLGQGACQALEDAAVLAESLDSGGGQSAYNKARLPRTQMVARRSRQVGAVAQWSAPAAVALRNAAMRLTPGSRMVSSLGPILDWTP
jgi:2-polyprenyl-6-methoxyphenol hydroxylase-like FAD-dependent oxidoreductase